jgi:transposase
MTGTKRGGRYPAELRERAVRMVFKHRDSYSSEWAAIVSISEQLGVNHETLRNWVRRAEVDGGQRPGVTSEERARIRELERENRELRRANKILKAEEAGCDRWASPQLASASRLFARRTNRRDLPGGRTRSANRCLGAVSPSVGAGRCFDLSPDRC